VISGFRRDVAENCALQGHYAATNGNSLRMFLENLSVPYSGLKNTDLMQFKSLFSLMH